jgi:hypothetical protein
MGLDIYFHKTKRSEWNEVKSKIEAFNELPEEEQAKQYENETHPTSDFEPVDIGYFRKVNFLMEFFNYEGNCEYQEISKGELEALQEACLEVSKMKPTKVEYIKAEHKWDTDRVETVLSEADQERCAEILPTQAGFFFGNTAYNQWYLDDVKEVLAWVTGVLKELADDEVVLMYCWW